MRSRLAPIMLLVATFALGAFVGGAATSFADRRGHARAHDRPRPSFVERLTKELELTAGQRDSIQVVFDRHQPAMDSLWQRMRPEFESERQLIRNEVTALLTPEQQAKYAALIQRLDSLRRVGPDRNRNGHL
jgi:Spy/CpxP family protein refolding chaperone